TRRADHRLPAAGQRRRSGLRQGPGAGVLRIRDRVRRGGRATRPGAARRLRIAAARVALGSVAQRPWRLTLAEAELPGTPLTREALIPVIERVMADAAPLPQNRFKVTMARNAAVR